MSAIPFHQRPEFLRGRVAEQQVAAWLQARGWYVIPCYDYSGDGGNKAPRSQGQRDAIVLPDLDIARSGSRKWAEVKAKWGPTWTVKTHTYDHGIGYRKWQHYRRIQRETGCFVWLFIIEEYTQRLLAESLDELGEGRVYDDNKMDVGGMVFWPRDRFRTRLALQTIPGLFDPRIPLTFEEGL